MLKRLPPLDTFRFFDAAARHMNFTRAAEELCVTPGAVSQRIKMLEEHVAVALFKRDGKSMRLTKPGRELQTRVAQALDDLTKAIERTCRSASDSAITVSVTPAFAMRWLMPRLHRFTGRHPSIVINIRPSQAVIDLNREDIDLAVRFGSGEWPGLRTEKLMDEELFPVCSPAFEAAWQISESSQLLNVPLLHEERQPWSVWFDLVSISITKQLHGPVYTDANLLVEAALAGHGVALARASFVRFELASGRLVRLFNQSVKTRFSHYLVYPKQVRQPHETKVLRAWLLEESACTFAKGSAQLRQPDAH